MFRQCIDLTEKFDLVMSSLIHTHSTVLILNREMTENGVSFNMSKL